MTLVALRDDDREPTHGTWARVGVRRSSLSLPDVSRPVTSSATTKESTEAAFQTWLEPFMESLEKLSNLPQGWGGPGSQTPHIALLFIAARVLAAIAKPSTLAPTLVPLLDGRVQLVWYAGGVELEILIDGDGTAKASLYDLTTQNEIDDVSPTDQRIADAIEKLSQP